VNNFTSRDMGVKCGFLHKLQHLKTKCTGKY